MRRIAVVSALALVMLASAAQVASAYSLMSDGYYRKSLGINTTSFTSSTYDTAINRAVSSWNNAGVGVSIAGGSAPYANAMFTQALGDGAYGLYVPLRVSSAYYPHRTTQFSIIINSSRGARLGTNGKQSIVGHELGHAWGLDEDQSNLALMNGLRNREVIYAPQHDDRYGVVASWRR